MNKTKFFKLMAVAGALSALAACGGGGDGEGDGGGVVVGQNGTVDVNSVSMAGGETCGIGGFAQALLAEINAARSKARKCGSTAMPAVPAIGYWNTLLQHAAVKHSADMATGNFFSHTGSDGSEPHDRAAAYGYQGGAGENLYMATGSYTNENVIVKRAVNWWLGSEGHCRAIMEAQYQEIGAACVKRGNTAYFTLDFGTGQ